MAARVDHAARRLWIAERATELFSKKGYDNVSLGMIAEASGVARTVLYRYFHSKREVLDEAILAHTRPVVADCAAVVAGPGTRRAKLLAVCNATVDRLFGRRAFLTAIYDFVLASYRSGEDMGAQVFRFTGRLRETLRELVTDGVAAGEFAADVDAVAAGESMMAILESLTLRIVLGMESDPQAVKSRFAAVVKAIPTCSCTGDAEKDRPDLRQK